jgi:cell division control protein 24
MDFSISDIYSEKYKECYAFTSNFYTGCDSRLPSALTASHSALILFSPLMASTKAGRNTVSTRQHGDSDTPPIANNTLLNKAASQSISLYQQCSSLRARLMHLHQFPPFFSLSSTHSCSSTDPVAQLWDLFALGVPLCYIFNLLPLPITPINVDTSPDFDVNNDRLKKRAIALFVMGVKQVPQTEAFTVRELLDRESVDGLVKVRVIEFIAL